MVDNITSPTFTTWHVLSRRLWSMLHMYVQDKLTPLHSAALKGHGSVLTLLLECGANVNAENKVRAVDGNYISLYCPNCIGLLCGCYADEHISGQEVRACLC